MAPRVEAARKRREALEAEYPKIAEVYDGFYLRLTDIDAEGSRFFLGAEGIIGSELRVDGKDGTLLSGDGRALALLPRKAADQLAEHASAGWRIKALISTVFFRAQDKCAVVDIAFVCWSPLDASTDQAFSAFTKNVAGRLASGDRASLALSQGQLVSVLRSGGAWYLTPMTKREPTEKGTVVYKSRRTSIERLTGFSLRHRVGCTVAASLFWVLVAAGVVALIWTLVSPL